MSASAKTILPGRHSWRSIYESLDRVTSKISSRQHPASRIGLHQNSSYSTTAFSGRFSSPQWHLPRYLNAFKNNVRRRFTSGGLLLISFGSSSPTSSTVVASCSAAADSVVAGNTTQKANISKLARQACQQRDIYLGNSRTGLGSRRTYATQPESKRAKSSRGAEPKKETAKSEEPSKQPGSDEHQASKYFHLPTLPNLSNIPHLPHLPRRPTKEEFMAAATGFWQRMQARLKWHTIRSMRPWNIDEWGAFVSWFLFGHLAWILVGTTTFVSLCILSINTVVAQETLAKWVGDYLTQSAGLTIIFESAIVPKWKNGTISFRNVFVSRRPGQIQSSISKGSSSDAAAVAAAERGSDGQPANEDDGNYTQFDVTINEVNVTLSFVKWWNGKGPLNDVEVKGVRGVIDRTSVNWSSQGRDPLSFRREHQPGDFEIENFKLEDLLVTIHQPNGFRPFSVSIYSCELPQLRKQFLFYDLLAANHMSGSYDGSLFTIHPRQVPGPITDTLGNQVNAWKKFSRIRIDGLKIDHLNRGVDGPFGWIYEGNVDIVTDVMFPADDQEGITKVISEFYEQLEEAVTSNRYLRLLESQKYQEDEPIFTEPSETTNMDAIDMADAKRLAIPQESSIPLPPVSRYSMPESSSEPAPTRSGPPNDYRYVIMDMRIHLNDVKAGVPLFTPDLSYINQALVRPIVAYINAKKTYIPISCRIVKRASDFDGSWTVFDCGLMDDASAEVYAAFARDVEDQQSRVRRLKKVGIWTLSLAVHALFVGMAGDLVL